MGKHQKPPPQHQVFINFRGKELRHNFISHLEKGLKDRGIKVFIDAYEDKGEDISKLLKRIEESRIVLVVFSSRYTESRWCLDELATIKERLDQGMLKVLPIFYKVDTSDVKRLKNEFGNNFRDREWEYRNEKHIIDKWKKALECISDKIGLPLDMNSSESDFIGKIVKEVLELLAKVSPTKEQTVKSQVNQLSGKGESSSVSSPSKHTPQESVGFGLRGCSLACPNNVSRHGNPAQRGLGSDLSSGTSLAPNAYAPRLQRAPVGQHFGNPTWFGLGSYLEGGNLAPNANFSRPGSPFLQAPPHALTTGFAGMGPANGSKLGTPSVQATSKSCQCSYSTSATGVALASRTNQSRPYSMMQSSPSGLSNAYSNHTAQYGQGQASFSERISVNGVVVSDYTVHIPFQG